jgi:hypothetical protein
MPEILFILKNSQTQDNTSPAICGQAPKSASAAPAAGKSKNHIKK